MPAAIGLLRERRRRRLLLRGREIAHWLLLTMNTTGAQTPARFMAS